MTFFKIRSFLLTSLRQLIKSPFVGATKFLKLGKVCFQERERFVNSYKRISLNSTINLPVFTTRVNALRACLNFGCSCNLSQPGIKLLPQFSVTKIQNSSDLVVNRRKSRPLSSHSAI